MLSPPPGINMSDSLFLHTLMGRKQLHQNRWDFRLHRFSITARPQRRRLNPRLRTHRSKANPCSRRSGVSRGISWAAALSLRSLTVGASFCSSDNHLSQVLFLKLKHFAAWAVFFLQLTPWLDDGVPTFRGRYMMHKTHWLHDLSHCAKSQA